MLLEIQRPVKVLIGFGKMTTTSSKKQAKKETEEKSTNKKNKKQKTTTKTATKSTNLNNQNEPAAAAVKGSVNNLIVYVPNCYLAHLISAQLESKDAAKRKADYVQAMSEHDRFFRQYTEKYLDNLFLNSNINLREVALSGNLVDQNVPGAVLDAIRADKLNVMNVGDPNAFPSGEYTAHRQQIRLPNGQQKHLVLKVIMKLNDLKTRHYREKNLNMTEVKEFYSIIYDLTLE